MFDCPAAVVRSGFSSEVPEICSSLLNGSLSQKILLAYNCVARDGEYYLDNTPEANLSDLVCNRLRSKYVISVPSTLLTSFVIFLTAWGIERTFSFSFFSELFLTNFHLSLKPKLFIGSFQSSVFFLPPPFPR